MLQRRLIRLLVVLAVATVIAFGAAVVCLAATPNLPRRQVAPSPVTATALCISFLSGGLATVAGIRFLLLSSILERRVKAHLCPNCAYQLTQILGTCPECGAPISKPPSTVYLFLRCAVAAGGALAAPFAVMSAYLLLEKLYPTANIIGWASLPLSIGLGAIFVWFLPIVRFARTILTLLYLPAMLYALPLYSLLFVCSLFRDCP